MNYKYFPHTDEEVREMLESIGMSELGDLYSDVPEQVRFRGDYDLPSAMSEIEVRRHFDMLCRQNQSLTVFAGAGVYDHYTPSIIPDILRRSEFLTSYTPYQAEISQGTLHYIFEFQSMMSELTGLPIANASMYDGATASAEAMLMAAANSKKCNRVLVSSTIDPKVLDVVRTYAHFHGVELVLIGEREGLTDRHQMSEELERGAAGVLVQQPNYYGYIEDYDGLADECHAQKSLFMMNCVAGDLALLKTPGEWGADVAVGDGQSLGIPMCYGGPSVGYMCCTDKLMRKMPGRIVGMTRDNRGQRVFALTLQAREQHIRRQKATSNICSNQSLMALFVTIYLSVLGKEGFREVAQRSYDAAHYLHDRLLATGAFTDYSTAPFFNEFCVRYTGDADRLQRRMTEHGILFGVKTADGALIIAATEKRTVEEMEQVIKIIEEDRA